MSASPAGPGSPGSSSVPSPTTAFSDYLPHLTAALDKLTTHAAALPDKSDLGFHRTLDRQFGKKMDATSERVLKVTDRVLALIAASQEAATKGKGKGTGKVAVRRKMEDEDDVVDGFSRSVVGVVDGLLEDADSMFDELKGSKGKTAIAVNPRLAAKAGQKLPGPFAERLPQALFNDTTLAKPQLLFPDVVDNFITTPWVPTITTKPHAMVPLDFKIPLEYDLTREEEMDPSKEYWRRDKEVRLRQHPYFYETRHISYPTSMFIDAPPIEPKSFEDTPFEYVDTPDALERMVEKLKVAKMIAVDLEHHQMRSYAGFTCLMQISTREGDWVVDTLKLRKELRDKKLGDVMADPGIVKVFHGADSDILWLQHDFEIYVVNLFDTYHACCVLNLPQRSLQSLLQQYCGFDPDKRYQRADWRIRPLPEAMLHYARSDTHFLLYIYDNLRNTLLHVASRPPSPDEHGNAVIELTRRNPQAAIREVLGRSAETALRLYEREVYDEKDGRGAGGWYTMGKKWLPKGGIDEEAGWVWKYLHIWRDKKARELDESPFYLLPNDVLRVLSLPHCRSATVIRQVVGRGDRAPLGAAHIDEIIPRVLAARSAYKKAEAAKPKPEEKEEVTTAKAKGAIVQSAVGSKSTEPPAFPAISALVESTESSVPDCWDFVAAPVSVRPAPKSGLFGSTIKSSRASSPSSVAAKPAKASSLFGQTLGKGKKGKQPAGESAKLSAKSRKEKALSPGFQAVQMSIHGELESKAVAAVKVASEDEKVDLGEPVKLEPETVPFVPAGARTTTKSAPARASSLKPAASPAPAVESDAPSKKASKADTTEEGVVQVKKSKKQKKRALTTSTASAEDMSGKKLRLDEQGSSAPSPSAAASPAPNTRPSSPAVSEPSEGKGKKKEKEKGKKKKSKVAASDIPEFDYTNQPNLLDAPQLATGVLGKKDKKKKKEQRPKPSGAGMIEVPRFGKPAKDMSQPKAGNKTANFAS
ncbi:hypothetical protein IAT38_007474 [Cryptococcus sp. DSM 104549]